MPKHILVKHLAKSHPNMDATASSSSFIFTVPDIPVEATVSKSENLVTSIPETKKWYEVWDAGEMNVCQQCKTEWPSKLMFFHIKLEHGL